MSYLALHHLHIACVVLSIALFLLRGGLGLSEVDWLLLALACVAARVGPAFTRWGG